ncbi:MAG: glycosyltransferase family 4 protein [Verrucomicrobiae bacterium]|nr:glycosyltransferase family 4 protein [Verrucomicrobiae bacterium]
MDETMFLQAVKPMLNPQPRPALLVVGQLVPRKGLFELLHAASEVQREGYVFSLIFVGDGPLYDDLKRLVGNLGMKHVLFLPSHPPEVMPSIYRSGDSLVFPTLEDVWGLVVNEAMWCGLPVLASCYAGCTEELVPVENVVDPKNRESLKAGLRRAIEGKLVPPDLSRLLTIKEVGNRIITDLQQILSREKAI